jgi:hypothetical protein
MPNRRVPVGAASCRVSEIKVGDRVQIMVHRGFLSKKSGKTSRK